MPNRAALRGVVTSLQPHIYVPYGGQSNLPFTPPAATVRRSRHLSDTPANLPPRFLRTPEAARFLGLSGRTLEKHRYFGTGPAYRRIGGRVVYSVDDLRAWADMGIKHSTSDPGQDDLMPRADSAIARSRR